MITKTDGIYDWDFSVDPREYSTIVKYLPNDDDTVSTFLRTAKPFICDKIVVAIIKKCSSKSIRMPPMDWDCCICWNGISDEIYKITFNDGKWYICDNCLDYDSNYAKINGFHVATIQNPALIPYQRARTCAMKVNFWEKIWYFCFVSNLPIYFSARFDYEYFEFTYKIMIKKILCCQNICFGPKDINNSIIYFIILLYQQVNEKYNIFDEIVECAYEL